MAKNCKNKKEKLREKERVWKSENAVALISRNSYKILEQICKMLPWRKKNYIITFRNERKKWEILFNCMEFILLSWW